MKTNPLTSLLNRLRRAICPGAQQNSPAPLAGRGLGAGLIKEVRSPNSPASPERRGGGKGAGWYARLHAAIHNTTALKLAKYLIPAILLFLLLLSLVACRTPATLTNDTQHRARDSNYHTTVHRIETHDTIIIRTLPPPPLKGGRKRPSKSPLNGDFVGPSKSP